VRILLEQSAVAERAQEPRGRALRLAGQCHHVRERQIGSRAGEAAQDLDGVGESTHAGWPKGVPNFGTLSQIL